MKIVIDIPEEDYKLICAKKEDAIVAYDVCRRIANGTPLPKGHGRLGDLDKLEKDMQDYHDDCAKTSKYTRLGFETAMAVVKDAHTIIEAAMAES